MASIIKHIAVTADAATAWDALADFGHVHERVARGFVTDIEVDGDLRTVTFANGAVARERLVAVDDANRRLVYTVVASSLALTHHQASVEVIATEHGTTLRWITDVLPDEAAAPIGIMMDAGAVAIAETFARSTSAA